MAEGDDQAVQGDVEQAWRVLGLVNDWLKHAETKAAAALTAAGVVGGVLYSLVSEVHDLPWLIGLVALICGLAVLTSGVFAGIGLWPRLKSKEPPTSPLYFNHIARQHADVSTYHDTLKLVTSKPDDMVRELAAQIWANAHVSHKKFRWAGYSIVALIVSLTGLAVVAAYLGGWYGQ